MTNLALDAVQTVFLEENGRKEIDIKRYVRVERIPGGEITDSKVLKGVMINKDVPHPKMRKRIENPRILLLDCPLEYKKAESAMGIEVTNPEHFAQILKQEEEWIAGICADIIKFKPDIVFTEKGLSDLAQHFFVKHNITAFRRVRKTDNLRIARAVGATICHRTDEIQEVDIGTGCGLFELRKIGDEFFIFLEECKNPKACTVLLRGANKEILSEIDRNLTDAMNVARNVLMEPKLVPGGGAIEMAMSQHLMNKSNSIEGVQQWTYRGIASALEIIPKTLAQNCGAKVVKILTELRAKHASDPEKNSTWGIDGNEGKVVDMKTLGIWEPMSVKSQTLKSAVESACLLLRVDDILSGISKKKGAPGGGPQQQPGPEHEDMQPD
jgi:T-complex protein 1 subunit gamma